MPKVPAYSFFNLIPRAFFEEQKLTNFQPDCSFFGGVQC